VTNPMMSAIKLLRVDPVDMPHADGQIAVDCFHEEVVVIVHEAVGVATPIEARCRRFNQIKETCPVCIVFKYRHSGVSTSRSGIFDAQWSCHI